MLKDASNQPQATSHKQQATSRKLHDPQATSRKQPAASRKLQALKIIVDRI